MAAYTNNATLELAKAIIDMFQEQRHSSNISTLCQYLYCTLPSNFNDSNITCDITSDGSSNDYQKGFLHSRNITKYLQLFIYPLFIIMGIFGNSLSCFIMFNNVRRHGYPSSLYLTLLAFVDCLFLLGSALPDWISHIHGPLDVKLISNFFCRFAYWFGHFTTHLSAGLVVGVTVERFIAVQYPLIAHKLNTVAHTRLVLVILFLFFAVVDSPVVILVEHLTETVHVIRECKNETLLRYERHEMPRCTLTNGRYQQTWVYIDLAVYALIPFLIIATLNSLIIHRLIDAQRFRQRMMLVSNNSSKSEQVDMKHRRYSESHQAIEMLEKYHRQSRRFRSAPDTKQLAPMLRPRMSQIDERRQRFSTKQSSLSTELSTLSFEIKTRSHHQSDTKSIRHKSINLTQSNNRRLTVLLLSVSCSFLALTLPIVVLNLIMSTKLNTRSSILNNHNYINSMTTDKTQFDTDLFYTLTRLLMIINHSINFILYFVLGKRFRRDLKQLFSSHWRQIYR